MGNTGDDPNNTASGGDPPSGTPAPPAAAATPPAAPPTGTGGSAANDPTGTGASGAQGNAADEKKTQAIFDTGFGKGIDKGRQEGRQAAMDELKAKGLTPERIDQLQKLEAEKKEAEKKRAEEEGRWQELHEKREKEHQEELARRDAELAKLKKQQQDFQIHQTLSSAVTASKVTAQATPQVVELLKGRVQVNEDGQTVVVGNDGHVVYDAATAKPMSVESFVQGFVESNPHFQKAVNPNGGSGGSGSPPSTTPPTTRPTAPANKEERLKMKPQDLIKAGLDERNKS